MRPDALDQRQIALVDPPFAQQLVQGITAARPDVDATLQDVSPGFERVTGYAREDVLGKTTGELFRVETADPTYYRQIGEGLAKAGATVVIAGRDAAKSAAAVQALQPLSRDAVVDMQTRLAKLGFYADEADGLLGPKTRSALRLFQKQAGLPADGHPTPEVAAKLRQTVR